MATLVSPGVEVTVSDESQYLPAATNSVPFILVASATDKVSGTDSTSTATGTTAANANKVNLVSSQRELVSLYGTPTFYSTTGGSALNGYELNEYGLLAAHSVLGISNRAYIQRVDVDLSQLSASLVRPVGDPANGKYWLDTANALWGIQEWSATTGTFTNKVPTVINDTTKLTAGVPLASVGAIGDYAVVTTNVQNPIYYKNRDNAWVQLGTDAWQNSWPSIQGSNASPTIVAGNTIVINGTTVTASGTTVASLATNINSAAITGITAAAVNNKLEIYADSDVTPSDSAGDGTWQIANGTGTILTVTGITATATAAAPNLQQTAHTDIPRWKSTDTVPRPSGSVWFKTTAVNNGVNIVVKKFNSTTKAWTTITAPVYENDETANKELDATGGGKNIAAASLYGQFDFTESDFQTVKLMERVATGASTMTSDVVTATLVNANTFTISASVAGSTTMSTAVTATISGTTLADYVTAFNAANVSNVSAEIVASGAVSISHSQGGIIKIVDVTGTPTATVVGSPRSDVLTGLKVGPTVSGEFIVSNWRALTYEAKATAPSIDPVTGTYWYDSSTDADIMIHDGTVWKGYKNVTNDTRGYNLSNTSPAGPIVAASAPTTQSDASALVEGDLWIDTSDLENYPKLYRWQTVSSVLQWVAIDTTDQTTENGILFADARWATSDVDTVTGDISTIIALGTSDAVDIDKPDPTLYPAGMLLFNTRRSGYSVKKFVVSHFNSADFPTDSLPTNVDTWVNASGNKNNGSAYMGRKAQRAIVTAALKAGIDSNTLIREEQKTYNLIACPGYPELIQNMVTLNNDRSNTGFVVGDTPFRLSGSSTDIQAWATNTGSENIDSEDGLVTADPYTAVFWPSGQTNDLSGSTVVVPPSHMALRVIVRNDEVSYPWLAPAGERRGQIDNASKIGYIKAADGEFESIATRLALRDTCYANKVNPITFLPGSGLLNYGNKTIAATPSALDRINVARLVAFLRDRLEVLAKGYIFEPNDKSTRDEVKNSVEQLMNDIVAKRGLYDYLVVCDETNNTNARIDRNELYVDIAIEPVKSVEFIYIPVRIKNTGDIDAGLL